MAVEDKYVNTEVVAQKLAAPYQQGGSDLKVFAQTLEVAAADDDGSIYRVSSVPGDAVPVKVEIYNDAITGGTDYDLGFYVSLEKGGAVKDKDALMDGTSMASAADAVNGMTALDIADFGKRVYEIAGDDEDSRLPAYDLALTANTVGTVAGTITVIMYYA
jgi:hypothetical protein